MDIVGNVLPNVLKDGGYEQKGEIARIGNFVGAMAIGDLVKTTLGPKGMDKILTQGGAGPQDGKLTVTNDGATILRSMHIDNPAARILIDISSAQDDEVGDGTTTVAVMCSELLKEAEKLINLKIHPQKIIDGYRMARDIAVQTLRDISRDNSNDQETFQQDLMNIAMTTLSSKLVHQEKEKFSRMAVDAVLRLKGQDNLDYIQIIKKLGGSIKDSFLCEGLILEKSIAISSQKSMKNCKVMVANTPMDYDKIKIYGTKVKVESMEKVAEIEVAEKEKMREKVDKICQFGPTVFINRQLIYDYPEQLLSDKGLMVIEHADFDGIERLAAATGAEILSTFNNPERKETVLGHVESIEEIMIGEDKLIRFSGCKMNESCTIVLRGSSRHILDEADRSLHDALCVLIATVKNQKTIYGGGNAEITMAARIMEAAKTQRGKQALAMDSYARALMQLPMIIAENGGYDAPELVQNLKVEIESGNKSAGLDMDQGIIGCMKDLKITECFRSKEQAIFSASEASEMIIRVDDIIKCAPRQRNRM